MQHSTERMIQAAVVRSDMAIVAASNAIKWTLPALVLGFIIICACRTWRGR